MAACSNSRTEIQYRVRFAERYPTEKQVCDGIAHFKSWHNIVNEAMGSAHVANNAGDNEQYTPGAYIDAATMSARWWLEVTPTRRALRALDVTQCGMMLLAPYSSRARYPTPTSTPRIGERISGATTSTPQRNAPHHDAAEPV